MGRQLCAAGIGRFPALHRSGHYGTHRRRDCAASLAEQPADRGAGRNWPLLGREQRTRTEVSTNATNATSAARTSSATAANADAARVPHADRDHLRSDAPGLLGALQRRNAINVPHQFGGSHWHPRERRLRASSPASRTRCGKHARDGEDSAIDQPIPRLGRAVRLRLPRARCVHRPAYAGRRGGDAPGDRGRPAGAVAPAPVGSHALPAWSTATTALATTARAAVSTAYATTAEPTTTPRSAATAATAVTATARLPTGHPNV